MTPSLANFLLRLLAGGVVVVGIGLAVAIVGSKDKLERTD